MDLIVKPCHLLKQIALRELEARRSLDKERNLQLLFLRHKSTKRSTEVLVLFQTANCQRIMTGETSRDTISLTSIETRVTVDHATLFPSLKLLSLDSSSNMERKCHLFHHNS